MSISPISRQLVTLTPAPAWDLTYSLPAVSLGEVQRTSMFRQELAGKGINVSRNLALTGHRSPAVFPTDGPVVSPRDDSALVPVSLGIPVRYNVTVIEDSGRTTKINQQALPVSPEQWTALLDAAVAQVTQASASWLLIAGTIPDGEHDVLETPVRLRQNLPAGVSIAVDTSGPVLRAWIATGAVALVKPNVGELAQCVGRELSTVSDVIDAAKEVRDLGVDYVLVSMGAEGFLGLHGDTVAWARARASSVRNTIGAGDASVAGFFDSLLREGEGFELALQRAAAWGAHKVSQSGSQLMDVDVLPEAQVGTRLPLSQPVSAD